MTELEVCICADDEVPAEETLDAWSELEDTAVEEYLGDDDPSVEADVLEDPELCCCDDKDDDEDEDAPEEDIFDGLEDDVIVELDDRNGPAEDKLEDE